MSSQVTFIQYATMRQPLLQRILQKEKHKAGRASPGVFPVGRAPLSKRTLLQSI